MENELAAVTAMPFTASPWPALMMQTPEACRRIELRKFRSRSPAARSIAVAQDPAGPKSVRTCKTDGIGKAPSIPLFVGLTGAGHKWEEAIRL